MEQKYEDNGIDIAELAQAVSVCLDEIVKLKEENLKLKEELAVRNAAVTDMVKELTNKLVTKIDGDIGSNNEKIQALIQEIYDRACKGIENVKYEANDPSFREKLIYPVFYPIDYTIDKLVKGASMSRFGDGEFALMSDYQRQGFQQLDERLRDRLREIVFCDEEDMCIGLADNYGALNKYNFIGAWGIRTYMTEEVRRAHEKYIVSGRTYHNAYISRPYVLYADNKTDAPLKRFENLKRIWNDRNVIFAEGFQTRLGYGNDLFDNAKSIRRIECPATDAFSRYDEILDACVRHGNEGDLFLLALGPAATVLAYDIYRQGFQAVDVGHIDLEYEWFRNNSGERCEVKDKYNNEWYGEQNISEMKDPVFLAEIIEKIY